MPAVAGSIVLAYNLEGLVGELKLTREVYVDIFLGKIKSWNDLRIKRINPELNFPKSDIALVVGAEVFLGSPICPKRSDRLPAVGGAA